MRSTFVSWRVLIKGLLLFILANLLFAIWNPQELGKFSAYNILFPGRLRFPFGENPSQAYNLSLFSVDAMFASHVIDGGQKSDDELRVIVIGDSSIWGTLLYPEETLTGQLNAFGLSTADEKRICFYNLGYPTISLLKDLMVLDQAMQYEPDLIIWPLTLEAFPVDKQLTSPIVAYNHTRMQELINKYGLSYDPHDPNFAKASLWDQTIIGQRRNLADLLRLQFYGVLWAATGVDQYYPDQYTPAAIDLDADKSFHDWQPPKIEEDWLTFEVIEAGLEAAGDVPVLIINEPMLISGGENSDLRYNFFYPRWAYDQYRVIMLDRSQLVGWDYLDLWDIVPADQFTNSAIHLTPHGVSMFAEYVRTAVLERLNP